MKSRFTRRSLLAGTTAVSATIVIKTGRAAEYTFVQYHNQAATARSTRTSLPCGKQFERRRTGGSKPLFMPRTTRYLAATLMH